MNEKHPVHIQVPPIPEAHYFTNFMQLYDYRAESAGDVPLYVFKEQGTGEIVEILPAQFIAQYKALGTLLSEQLPERSHIAILGDNSFAWLLANQAIMCSNNVSVATDRNLEPDVLVRMLRQSDCTAIFYSKAVQEKIDRILQELPLKTYVLDDWRALVDEGQALIAAGKQGCLEEKLDGHAPAMFFFTSGSTGNSKCVMLSMWNLLSSLGTTVIQAQIHYDTVLVLPLHHVYGFNSGHLPYVIQGRRLFINTNPREMFRDFMRENPTDLVVVPLYVELFYKMIWKTIREHGLEEKVRGMIEENRKKPDLTLAQKREMFHEFTALLGKSVEVLFVGGAPMSEEYFYAFRDFGIDIDFGYGITECSPIVTATYSDDGKPGSVGPVMAYTEVKIDKPDENGRGEVCVKGSTVMLGYYKDEQATQEAMPDGFFHTGDIGYFDEDGFLFLSGRIKNLIILSNGENVSPEEIETRLDIHPGISQVVVYQKIDKIAAQIYIAEEYLAEHPVEEAKREIEQFIDAYNQTCALFKQISVIEFRDTPFAMTSSKKILRNSVI